MSQTLRRTVYLLLGVLALFTLMEIVRRAPARPQTERKVIAISHPAAGVTFVASLDSNRISPDSTQTLHLEMLREADYRPGKIEVCAKFPGSRDADSKDDTCTSWPSRNGIFLPLEIPVQPPSEPESQFLTVTIKADPYPVPHSKLLPFQESVLRLGPLRVERYSPAADKFFARLKSLAKDFSWPIVVVAVGAWFTNRAGRRAEQDEVRRVLLSKVQGLTKRFYTHLVYHARNASSNIEKGDALTSSFHLFSLLTFNARIKLEEGGVFFTNLDGENVYRCAIAIVFGAVRDQRSGEAQFRSELDAFARLDPAHKPGSDSIPAPRPADYLKHPPAVLTIPIGSSLFRPALDILRIVTEYENDAPLYEYWYKKTREIQFSDKELERVNSIGPAEANDETWQELLTSMRRWLEAKPNTSKLIKKLPAPTPKPRNT
jgi:hypothetical protein